MNGNSCVRDALPFNRRSDSCDKVFSVGVQTKCAVHRRREDKEGTTTVIIIVTSEQSAISVSPPPHPGGEQWAYVVTALSGTTYYVDTASEIIKATLAGYDEPEFLGDDLALVAHYDDLVGYATALQKSIVATAIERDDFDPISVSEDVFSALLAERLIPFEGIPLNDTPDDSRVELEWGQPVPLVLLATDYQPFTERPVPTGNITWLDPSTEVNYLRSLHNIGVVKLDECTQRVVGDEGLYVVDADVVTPLSEFGCKFTHQRSLRHHAPWMSREPTPDPRLATAVPTSAFSLVPGTRRRRFLLEPGQVLLMSESPVRNLMNHVGAARALGLTQAQLSTSRLSPLPIPVNGGRSARRRIDEVKPAMMWLPLLWLPERLAQRVRFQFIDGELFVLDDDGYFAGDPHAVSQPIAGHTVSTETTDLWVIRVALELEASGVYDEETGTWTDVLDGVGLSVEDRRDVQRVRRWLEGGVDHVLDDLDESFMNDGRHVPEGESPSWAIREALGGYQDLLNATWALGTNSMLNVVTNLAHDVAEELITRIDETKYVANMACLLSGSLLQWYCDDEVAWWDEMSSAVQQLTGTPSELVAGPLVAIDERLTEVRGETWAKMQAACATCGDED